MENRPNISWPQRHLTLNSPNWEIYDPKQAKIFGSTFFRPLEVVAGVSEAEFVAQAEFVAEAELFVDLSGVSLSGVSLSGVSSSEVSESEVSETELVSDKSSPAILQLTSISDSGSIYQMKIEKKKKIKTQKNFYIKGIYCLENINSRCFTNEQIIYIYIYIKKNKK